MAKDAIIKKIISDAELKSQEIVSEATKNSEAKISAAKKKAEDILNKAKNDSVTLKHDILVRQKTVADLDKRKVLLNAKQEVIDEVFSEALKELVSLKKEEYLDIITRLIKQYSEDGDEIIKGKGDKHITNEYVENLSKELKKKLSLSKEEGNFNGGIMLSQKGCDKNLTFEALLRLSRDENEYKVAEILFK